MYVRNLLIAGAVGVVALAGYFLFFRHGTEHITNYPSQGSDIVAFGDSLVVGYGASPGHDFVSVLSQKIGEPIINLGQSGYTTADALARIGELDRYQPKVVIVLLGGNDFIQKISSDTTYQNLAAIIQNIQNRGAIVLLLGVRSALLSEPFNGNYEKLHSTYGTAYISDVLSGLFGDPNYMSDEVHPNDAGYQKIADRIYPVLQPLLH